MGAYDGTLRQVLHALKYGGRRSIAPSPVSADGDGGSRRPEPALISSCQCHSIWRRRRERGFNQSEDLARHLGVPAVPVLRRVKATRPQVDLPAAARRDNVRDAFAMRRVIRRQSVIVLVDDVATTGATLEACARVLKAAGAAEIRALTAARVVNGPRPAPPR
jgi:predicted amidophosphoribosyltransferase